MPDILYFATTNKGKLREVAEILKPIKVRQLVLDIPEIRSDSTARIAEEKARYAAKLSGHAVLAEDSGLFVDALNGFPGAYSAHAWDKIGNEGMLRLMRGARDRSARFISAVAYSKRISKPHSFVGELNGKIARSIRGKSGFGYDPIFIPQGFSKTNGELGLDIKNTISHRKKALEKFKEWYLNVKDVCKQARQVRL